MQNKKSIYFIFAKTIFICSIIILFSIATRIFVRNIMFEKLNIAKPWMLYILRGDVELKKALGEPVLENSKIEESEKENNLVDYKELYPFYEEEDDIKEKINAKKDSYKKPHIIEKISKLENKIEQYTSNNLFFYNEALKLFSLIEKTIIPSVKNDSIIYMKNGYLTNPVYLLHKEDINKLADNLESFSVFLQKYNIPFIYTGAGTKVCKDNKQLPLFAQEYSNENLDNIFKECKKHNVKTFDFRKAMIEDGLDWYKHYYKTDHHWTTEAGFYAAKKIATILNNDYSFNLDLSYFDSNNWNIKTYQNVMFGGQGRTATLANAQKESFTIFLPNFDTDFEATIPINGTKKTGSFENALMRMDNFNKVLNYTDYEHQNEKYFAYHSSFLNNAALSTIINKKSSNGKKILFLSDSFSWYLVNFLACNSGIKQIDVIHPSNFTGSIKRYTEQTKPDIVIMLSYKGALEVH